VVRTSGEPMSEMNDFGEQIARAREESVPPDQVFADLLGANGSEAPRPDSDLRGLVEELERAKQIAETLADREGRLVHEERRLSARSAELDEQARRLGQREHDLTSHH